LARKTIVGGQYKVTIGQSAFVLVGTKQITSVYALSGNFFIVFFLTVSDVAPKPCDVKPLAKSLLNRVPLFW